MSIFDSLKKLYLKLRRKYFKRRIKFYQDTQVTLYDRPDDNTEEYDELEIEFEGEKTKLLDFDAFYDEDGKLLAAFKTKRDSPTALYWVEPGGDEYLQAFEEYVQKNLPDYELVDMRYVLRRNKELEDREIEGEP